MENIHGTLVGRLLKVMDFEDPKLLGRLQKGFQVVGHLDRSVVGMVAETRARDWTTLEELWITRQALNEYAPGKVRSSEFDHDLTNLAKEDAVKGCRADLVKMSPEFLGEVPISRRIAVRERKQSFGAERTRPAHHGFESSLKAATWSDETIQVQGLECLTTMVLYLYVHRLKPRFWKRDFKSAFRSCSLDQLEAWCSWSAWEVGGEVLMSRHVASPFGWVSSCFAFHRLGEFLDAILVRSALRPNGPVRG